MDDTSSPVPRSCSHLVAHDIQFAREVNEKGEVIVTARVACERRNCLVDVGECARCPRFARIEPHEAGYLLLCHSQDEP